MTSSGAHQKFVAAIVIAYNEEETIGPIVKTIVESRLFRDVIVITDGSTDHSSSIARDAGAALVHQFPWKHGKGAAMMHGVAHTDAQILFFFDADLIGLTKDHIQKILQPVLEGRLAMCMGIRDRGALLMKLTAHLPLIGGERAMQRQIFERIPDRFMQGYMVETSMNYYCRVKGLPYGTVELPGLKIRRKMQKVGMIQGLSEYIREFVVVFWNILVVRIEHLRGNFI